MQKVDEGVIELRYNIYEYEVDGEVRYDWHAGNGDEADYLFDTAEEATADVTQKYS